MKTIFLFLILSMLDIAAQTGDNLKRTEIYLTRSDSTFERSTAKSFRLLTIKDAQKLFGTNYKTKRIYADLFEVSYTEIDFTDGLILNFPDAPKMDKAFTVKSDKYVLILENGQKIKVGMSAEDLKRTFPNSFSQRRISNGKTSFHVNFSFVSKGKLYIEDSWITFILTSENGILKEFYTWEAG